MSKSFDTFSTTISSQNFELSTTLSFDHRFKLGKYLDHFTFLLDQVSPQFSTKIIYECNKVFVTSIRIHLDRTTYIRVYDINDCLRLASCILAEAILVLLCLHTFLTYLVWNVNFWQS